MVVNYVKILFFETISKGIKETDRFAFSAFRIYGTNCC